MEQKPLRIRSVQYIHDPEAVNRWYDLLVNQLLVYLQEEAEKSEHRMCRKEDEP